MHDGRLTLAVALATARDSPVTIRTLTPRLRHLPTAAGASGRGGALNPSSCTDGARASQMREVMTERGREGLQGGSEGKEGGREARKGGSTER
eukprot:342260-Rhodomonas_salina.4